MALFWFSFLLQPLAFSLQGGAVRVGFAEARLLVFELIGVGWRLQMSVTLGIERSARPVKIWRQTGNR
jgi:hypothetical protein